MSKPPKFKKYNLMWEADTEPLAIEFWCIRQGADHCKKNGRTLLEHYVNAKRMLWPNLDEHRWATLSLEKMVENKSCVLMGCASSGKTHTGAVFSLITYFASPEDTCILVSSTQMNSLKKRIWSEITMLWEDALARHDWLPGHMLDSAVAITTDSLEDSDYGERKARDMRKGVFGVACVQGGKFVGLSRYMGIKQKNMVLVADELSAMAQNFLSAVSNLNANESFKFIGMGNPNDLHDPLGKVTEPAGSGWSDEFLEPKKTTWWKTRFLGGVCVNLVGGDSPNFDYPPDEPTRYRYLISKEKIQETLSFFTEDSQEYYTMARGVMRIGLVARRVLSRSLCEQFGAQTRAVWDDAKQTSVYFVDTSYGGDRCVAGAASFGKEVGGKIIISFQNPKIIPIKVGGGVEPEQQIAEFVKSDCESLGIPPENMGHDATGSGGLGTALARAWSAKTHPVESGGRPSQRPVSLDLYITDEQTGLRRLKRCDEHYDRRVSEYAFQLRYAVESGQVRDLPEEAMEELCSRKWDLIRGNLYSIEVKSGTATRPGYKERVGKSPDMADWASGIIEMARRLGFHISKLAIEQPKVTQSSWLSRSSKSFTKMMKSRRLQEV